MKPSELGFNVYAMAKPETPEDYLALLAEANRELDLINCRIEAMFQECELTNRILKMKRSLGIHKPNGNT